MKLPLLNPRLRKNRCLDRQDPNLRAPHPKQQMRQLRQAVLLRLRNAGPPRQAMLLRHLRQRNTGRPLQAVLRRLRAQYPKRPLQGAMCLKHRHLVGRWNCFCNGRFFWQDNNKCVNCGKQSQAALSKPWSCANGGKNTPDVKWGKEIQAVPFNFIHISWVGETVFVMIVSFDKIVSRW